MKKYPRTIFSLASDWTQAVLERAQFPAVEKFRRASVANRALGVLPFRAKRLLEWANLSSRGSVDAAEETASH
jgi:hypothetical protein